MAIQIPGYRVVRKINQGGMASVYLAIQISVGRVVALKVMSSQFNRDPDFSERFQREATIVGQLSHPHIVSIYDIGCHDQLNYIAMDYLPNGTVHERMASGISLEEALRITRELASALDHTHEKGYIHRDIKPENILFRANNSSVLSDFGVARGLLVSPRTTQAGTVVGTPHYMSPEQTKGRPLDGRSDLYSLGVVLFEMLTGSVPYPGDEAVSIALKHISAPIPRLPSHLALYQPLIDRLLAKDPDHRFQRGQELADSIAELELLTPQVRAQLPTHPADLGVMPLLRALLSATGRSLRRRWQQLQDWRWHKGLGLYRASQLAQLPQALEADDGDRRTQVYTQLHPSTQPGIALVNIALIAALAAALIALAIYLVRPGSAPAAQANITAQTPAPTEPAPVAAEPAPIPAPVAPEPAPAATTAPVAAEAQHAHTTLATREAPNDNLSGNSSTPQLRALDATAEIHEQTDEEAASTTQRAATAPEVDESPIESEAAELQPLPPEPEEPAPEEEEILELRPIPGL